MSTITVRPHSKYQEPDRRTLVGDWSPRRYRGQLSYDCVFHKGGKVYILNTSDKFLEVDEVTYMQSLSGSSSQNPASRFVNPYSPKKIIINAKTPEMRIEKDSDAYKFFSMCPYAVLDGMEIDSNPNSQKLFYLTSDEITSRKNYIGLQDKLTISNFVSGLSDEQLKNVAYYFGRVPNGSREELLVQLIGENGVIFSENFRGETNVQTFKDVFMAKEGRHDTEIITVINQAVSLNVIQKKNNPNKLTTYHWEQSFLGTSVEEVYSFFGKDERLFNSLKNAISRASGGTVAKSTDELPKAAKTEPNRSELWASLQSLAKEGFIKVPEGITYQSAKREQLVSLVAKAEENKTNNNKVSAE